MKDLEIKYYKNNITKNEIKDKKYNFVKPQNI